MNLLGARGLAGLAIAAMVAAFYAGTRMAPSDAPPVPSPVASARVASAYAGAAPAAHGLTREDIRDVVREELAQVKDLERPIAAPRDAARVVAAVTAANAIVADGLARGRWSEQERAALRVQLVHLGGAEIQEVVGPLFQAINAQRLEIDGAPI